MALNNINDCYIFTNTVANKNQSGSLAPDNWNNLASFAVVQYQRLKLGLPELYTVDKRQAPQEIQVTQAIDDSLRKFIKRTTVSKSGDGFDIPVDMAAFVPSSYLYTYVQDGQAASTPIPLDFVTASEWNERMQNYITNPTYEYPMAMYENGQIVVAPNGIDTIGLRYYRYPVNPVWGYTVNASDQAVYDPLTSVDFEFPKLEWENICNIILKYWAIYLRGDLLYQTTDKRIITGQ